MNKQLLGFALLLPLLSLPLMSQGQEEGGKSSPWSVGVWGAGSLSWYRDLGDIEQNYLSLSPRWGSSIIVGYRFGQSDFRLDGIVGIARRRDLGGRATYYLSFALTPGYFFKRPNILIGIGPQFSGRKHWDLYRNEFRPGVHYELEYLFRVQKRWYLGKKYQLFVEGRSEYGLTPFSVSSSRGLTKILYSRGVYLGIGIEWGG